MKLHNVTTKVYTTFESNRLRGITVGGIILYIEFMKVDKEVVLLDVDDSTLKCTTFQLRPKLPIDADKSILIGSQLTLPIVAGAEIDTIGMNATAGLVIITELDIGIGSYLPQGNWLDGEQDALIVELEIKTLSPALTHRALFLE